MLDLLIAFEEGIDPIERGDLYWSLNEQLPALLLRQVDILTEKQLQKSVFLIKVMNRHQNCAFMKDELKHL